MATIKTINPTDLEVLNQNYLRELNAVEEKFQTRSPRVEITITETEPGFFSFIVPHYAIEALFATGMYEDEIQDCISELESYLDGYFTCYDRMNVKNMTEKPTIIATKSDIEGYFHDVAVSNEEISDVLDNIAEAMNQDQEVMELYWGIAGDEVCIYVKEHALQFCARYCSEHVKMYRDEYSRVLRIMDEQRCPLRYADEGIYNRIADAINDFMTDYCASLEIDAASPDAEDVFWECNFKFNED